MKPVAETLVTLTAKERGLKIATAESCTGGLISASLTEVAGSSAVFRIWICDLCEHGQDGHARSVTICVVGSIRRRQ